MMDSDGLSDEQYGNPELDELMKKEFFDSSSLDEEGEMLIIMSIQQEMYRRQSTL